MALRASFTLVRRMPTRARVLVALDQLGAPEPWSLAAPQCRCSRVRRLDSAGRTLASWQVIESRWKLYVRGRHTTADQGKTVEPGLGSGFHVEGDQFGGSLRDRDSRRLRQRAGDPGHDGRVRHPQPVKAVDP